MNKPAPPVVIVGCGDIGTLVARKYLDSGAVVTGVVRSDDSVNKLQTLGINALQKDLSKSFDLNPDSAGSRLFYFAPPPASGITDIHTQHLIEALQSSSLLPSRLVYISTTGVYGDCEGRWVDENEPAKPQADRAKRRLDAEQQLLKWSKTSGVEIVIIRVAGIYGPGKLPLARLKKGLPVISESESPYTNRIHSTDLVNIAIAAMNRGKPGNIYHACDGHPGTMTDYFKKVASKAGLQSPPEISLDEGKQQLSEGMMSYIRESRRLRNEKTLRELDLKLQYPTLEEGLDHCGL